MIGRKGGNGKALADLLARREKAEHEAEQAAQALAKAEAETEQKLQAVALSTATPEAFAAEKSTALAVLGTAQAGAERTRLVLSALSEECDRVAVVVAEERLTAAEAEVVSLTEARDEAAEKLRDLTGKLNEAEQAAEKARRAIGRAARFSPAAAETARVQKAQDDEQVQWHSLHSVGHPERWPLGLEDAITAAIEERRRQWHEEQAKLRAESEQSLASVGLTPETAAEALGVGQSREWPRKGVR